MQSFTDHAGRFLAVFLLVAAAAGCGGGDGDSNVSAAVITSASATAVASNANQSVDNTYDFGNFGSDTVIGAAIGGSSADVSLAGFAREQLWRLPEIREAFVITGMPLSVVATITDNCPGGGTFQISANDANNSSELDSGDTVSITYNNCKFISSTYNGSFTLSDFVLTGDLDSLLNGWSMSATFTFSNLRLASGANESFTLNGDFSFSASSNDGVVETGSLSANSLSLSAGSVINTLISYTLDYTFNESNNAYTIEANGILVNSDHGSVTIATPTTFEGLDPAYPSIGVLKVTGASNSSVTLTAVDSTNVTLEVDEDGDGVTDDTINTTWAALDAA